MSAPQTLTPDRITVDRRLFINPDFDRGRTGEECPRSGYVELHRKYGKSLLIKTRCKQKRCKPCSPAVRAHAGLKAEIGALIHGASYFITLTNKMGIGLQKDAGSVQVDWRRFLYHLKRSNPEMTAEMKWMKVVELTQRGQPHLHLIVSGLPGGMPVRCPGRKNERSWVQFGCFMARGTCLLHAVSKSWLAATKGVSWVCDASKVYSPAKAGLYVAKYITKGFEGEDGMARLGFKRVWSTSRGFAPDLRVRLAGTVEGKWTKVEHFRSKYSYADRVERDSKHPDLQLTGHPLVLQKIEDRSRRKKLKEIEDFIRDANNFKTIDSKRSTHELRQGNRIPALATRV